MDQDNLLLNEDINEYIVEKLNSSLEKIMTAIFLSETTTYVNFHAISVVAQLIIAITTDVAFQ